MVLHPISSPKVSEISKDGQVNLGYPDPSKNDYVSVSGRAEIVRDKATIAEKWSEPLKAWFPDGKDDPQIALIRVHPDKGETGKARPRPSCSSTVTPRRP